MELVCCSGVVRQDCEDGSYFVEDSVGDLERIWREDIVTDRDDAKHILQVHMHHAPCSPAARAPLSLHFAGKVLKLSR